MLIPQQFSEQLPLKEQILYVLSILPSATADEVAMELMELKGVASEGRVSDLTHDVEQELKKLLKEGAVTSLTDNEQKAGYRLLKE